MGDLKITEDVLQSLIASRVREEVAKLMTSTTPDEQIQKALDRARGKDKPLPPEDVIECRSPLTGATFKARLIGSRTFPQGRVIELLDYVRPEGWDKFKADGGLVPDGMTMQSQFQPGKPDKLYANWVRKEFWQKDVDAIVGKPLAHGWRVSDSAGAPPAGSVVLTPEQLAKLGISADDVAAALAKDAA